MQSLLIANCRANTIEVATSIVPNFGEWHSCFPPKKRPSPIRYLECLTKQESCLILIRSKMPSALPQHAKGVPWTSLIRWLNSKELELDLEVEFFKLELECRGVSAVVKATAILDDGDAALDPPIDAEFVECLDVIFVSCAIIGAGGVISRSPPDTMRDSAPHLSRSEELAQVYNI